MKINLNDQQSLGNSDPVHIKREKENTKVRYLKLLKILFNSKLIIHLKISLKEKKKDKECKIIFINENCKTCYFLVLIKLSISKLRQKCNYKSVILLPCYNLNIKI